jgi:D-alanyl-D-alanine carboxypeptidase
MHAVRRTFAAAPLLLCLAASALPARGEEPKKDAPPEPKDAKSEAAKEAAPAAANKITITLADGKTVHCREQTAQPFLIRGNWFPRSNDADKVKEGRKMLEEAIKYRTEKYGYFEGFGNPKANKHPPKYYAKSTSFMGMNVQVHEKIIPALKCVEAALKAGPAGNEYKPAAMGGIRFRNTYKGVEVSNHVYGIAIDIEPDKNTCCGCVAPWNTHPLCKQKNKSVWERMVMPRSWVETFEKYGFYWLGHDTLQDTMHFEFLGDPDKITETPTNVAAN